MSKRRRKARKSRGLSGFPLLTSSSFCHLSNNVSKASLSFRSVIHGGYLSHVSFPSQKSAEHLLNCPAKTSEDLYGFKKRHKPQKNFRLFHYTMPAVASPPWLQAFLYRFSSYTRLHPSSPSSRKRRHRIRVVKLSSGKSWKIKRFPKIKLRWFSPLRILSKIRDAYVDFMLAADSKLYSPEMVMGTFGLYGTVKPFGDLQVKEYDKKVLVEMYKSSLAKDELAFARS